MISTLVPITISPEQLQLRPGEQKSAKVTVRNRLEQVGEYFLQVEGVPREWADIVPDQVALFPLEETRAEIKVHPPASASGATYHITVRAVSPSRPDAQGQALLEVQIPNAASSNSVTPAPPPRVVVPNKPQSAAQIALRVEPVNDNTWHLRVRNAGGVIDTFDLSAVNLPPAWVQFDAYALTLKPNEEASATLRVVPERNAQARAYDFKLRATSRLNVKEQTELPLKYHVRASAGFKFDILPREAESQGARDFKLSLTSDAHSNADVWLELSAADPENACDYVFQQNIIFLPARQTATTALTVRARTVLNPNERRVVSFQVTARARDGSTPTQTQDARLVQVGAAPLNLTLRPQALTADLEGVYTLSVLNPAPLETTLNLSAEDPEGAGDYVFQPNKLVVPSRAEAQVRLRVKAREFNEEDAERTISFVVTATRGGDLSAAGRTEGRLVQQPIKPLTLQLTPSQQSAPGAVRYLLTAINPRPSVARLSFDGVDETDALAFSFSPPEMAVSPGAEARAAVVVRPKDKLMPTEQRRVHHFTISARAQGALKPVTVAGILAQVRFALGDTIFSWLRGTGGALQWILFAVMLLVLINIAFAIVDQLGCRSSSFHQISLLIKQNILGTLLLKLPLSGPIQQIVRLIAQGVSEMTGQPFGCG